MIIGERAYGALMGCVVGEAMGAQAEYLTPNQVRWYYEDLDGFAEPDPEVQQYQEGLRTGEPVKGTEEMLVLANMMLKERSFSEEAFAGVMKNWCEESELLDGKQLDPFTRVYLESVMNGGAVSPAAAAAQTNGGVLRAIPLGIKFYYDPDICVMEALRASSVSHAARPAVAAACAAAGAVAACHNEENDLQAVMDYAVDAAVYGERNSGDICSPSVSRRIRQAKKIVDGAKGSRIDYLVDEMTGIFGAGRSACESVPLALGLFYAAGGDPAVALPAAVRAGDDATVNAAICGAVCGAFSGVNSFPKDWIARGMKATGLNLKAMGRQLLRRV